ncbi:hypothetical protein [Dyadobacter pollutisoli]|uniref:Uncharacterized protein n=1 Tax=Dyadobacter pollutisoli TaxID=2910158 RepID=A0A9E8SKP2_9BACT|nr:hypothetical protein [Dyadobacter pollutisoli]WAC11429.1 hypothetical protein ON006_27310 [Dyadobacter pollutisoli]
MKKILFILLVCAMRTGTSYAQDLIVTSAGDSIYCKITRERDGYVYFSYNKEGVPTNTLIASDSIANKQKGLYKTRIRYAGQESFARWQYRVQGELHWGCFSGSSECYPSPLPFLNHHPKLLVSHCKFLRAPGAECDFVQVRVKELGVGRCNFLIYSGDVVCFQPEFRIVLCCQVFVLEKINPQPIFFKNTKWFVAC